MTEIKIHEYTKEELKAIRKTRTKMPEQDAVARGKNFEEVALGYNIEDALREANRCMFCAKKLCVNGCPVEVPIPEFIKLVKEGDFLGGAKKIKEKNPLPAVCGRVCPQESQCESLCTLAKKNEPVAIGRLERFVADYERMHGGGSNGEVDKPKPTGFKVAVIGSGPAGLVVASDLAKLGHDVTMFEALHKAGGVLVYGIPEFRLPKAIVQSEVDGIKALGVDIKANSVIGKLHTIDELIEAGFDAVFIGSGAGLPMFMNIPGENLNGVYSANEFLTRTNLMKAYLFPEFDTPIKKGAHVAVVGGGNVAMDAARTALRLGAENVYLVYRRSMEELPARQEEVHHAIEEGIDFRLLTNPVEVIGEEGWVRGIKCIKMELGEPDESGRRRPVPIEGSEYTIEVDTVVIAIGTGSNPIIPDSTPGLDLNKWGYIVAGDNGQTSKPGVFAGGDIVTGAATVILAAGAGRKAANAIHEYLMSKVKN
ncbi:MAG: NADPH-dependent glutamate synthase [Actinobacteria bacterium]|nr:NADPH-dependent glutamate synthase [Actinomycetota bacterium]